MKTVKAADAPRTRRARQAEQTRLRILDAAATLFADPGYSATTMEAIADRADVAVETVYSRFRRKANLLSAILDPAIVGSADYVALMELPDVDEIRKCGDQKEQLRLLARFSRAVLERTATIHRIMHTAAASDPNAAALERDDRKKRYKGQSEYIDMLLSNGPLRDDMSKTDAAHTYAALANPETFAFMTEERGWTPDRYEAWLRDSLIRLLLQ